MADYSVWVSDAFGTPLVEIDYFHSLNYVRAVNGVGVLNMILPYTFDFKDDYRLGVWRKIGDKTYLDTDTVFFVRKRTGSRDSRGKALVTVTALSALTIASSRIVAHYSGSPEAKKDDVAVDDMMKQIVRENLTNPSDPLRSLLAYLSVDPNETKGPVSSKSFAWRNVLDVLADLSLISSQLEYPIYYDIEAVYPDKLVFKTYPLLRGSDLTVADNQLILSEEMGTLTDVVISNDATQEVSFVYSGGQGEGSQRIIKTAADDFRIKQSPFGRREGFRNASNSDDENVVQAVADGQLKAGRPLFTFNGTILSNERAQYGIDWRFGDLLVANVGDRTYNCMVDSVRVNVSEGRETITADLRVG